MHGRRARLLQRLGRLDGRRGEPLIVLDTHVWLWWETNRKRLSRAAARAIERAETIGICTISVFEMGRILERDRARLPTPLRSWVKRSLAHERVRPLPLTVDVALDAAQLRFVGDPGDRVIYATARAEDAQIVTRDERMHAFDPERAVW